MYQFILGIVTGVYIAQEYPKEIPRVSTKIKKLLEKIKDDPTN